MVGRWLVSTPVVHDVMPNGDSMESHLEGKNEWVSANSRALPGAPHSLMGYP